jgi:class 3 adenylate cyclase
LAEGDRARPVRRGLSGKRHLHRSTDRTDDQALKDIGVSSAGHRLRIRRAIAKLAPAAVAEAKAESTVAATEASAAPAVMFCDLVGSTALSARLDPEELRDVIGAYHRSVTEAVRCFDGFVAK